jgi:hypothetical protein
MALCVVVRIAMRRILTAHFDGKVIVPDRTPKLPIGKRLRIQVDVESPKNGKPPRKRRLIGTGKFSSGIPDLASNKKHMEGFGKK